MLALVPIENRIGPLAGSGSSAVTAKIYVAPPRGHYLGHRGICIYDIEHERYRYLSHRFYFYIFPHTQTYAFNIITIIFARGMESQEKKVGSIFFEDKDRHYAHKTRFLQNFISRSESNGIHAFDTILMDHLFREDFISLVNSQVPR